MCTPEPKVHNPDRGVYYARRDYAGLPRRFLILLIDAVVLTIILFTALVIPVVFGIRNELGVHLFSAAFLGLCFMYFVILGRSRIGTFGYLVGGVSIVNLKGSRPSILQMTGRILFASFGWPSVLLEVLWSGGELDRQALHDKLAGTYVVKKGAQPFGHGEERYALYDIGASTWLFREISRHVT